MPTGYDEEAEPAHTSDLSRCPHSYPTRDLSITHVELAHHVWLLHQEGELYHTNTLSGTAGSGHITPDRARPRSARCEKGKCSTTDRQTDIDQIILTKYTTLATSEQILFPLIT
jgi:hypothetical protein